MPYWNLGQTFDYAEMAYLMVPRPFMIERGHLDMVGRDSWVAHEYAKVRWLYAQIGLADHTEIEFLQGGHSIHGEGTFAFLHRHLKWPGSCWLRRDARASSPNCFTCQTSWQGSGVNGQVSGLVGGQLRFSALAPNGSSPLLRVVYEVTVLSLGSGLQNSILAERKSS
jgi:hypothetical protein